MSSNNDNSTPDAASQMYEELGRALATWGAVEAALAGFYAIAVNHDKPLAPIHSYWAVAAFEGKLKLANAGIQVALTDQADLREKWTTLYNRISRQKKTRNKLAHGAIQSFYWKSKKGERFDTCFVPYGFSVRDTKMLEPENEKDPFRDPRPKDRMYYKEIRTANLCFYGTQIDLWDISDELYRRLIEQQGLQPPDKEDD